MIDISEYLTQIKNGTYYSTVSSNIADAAEVLDNALVGDQDISEELEIIRTGVYGRDVRQAIHDALYKLSLKEGDNVMISGLNAIVRLSAGEYNLLEHKDPFTLYIINYTNRLEFALGTLHHSVRSDSITAVESLTQAQYDALTNPRSDTVYVIEGDET